MSELKHNGDTMSIPVIVVFGILDQQFFSPFSGSADETQDLDCRCYLTDSDLTNVLARDRPNVIVTKGKETDYPNLMKAPINVRKKWINFDSFSDNQTIGANIYNCYLNNALGFTRDTELVTVFTTTFRTGWRIRRPYESLLRQTYNNWEWVIFDDSDDDGITFKELTNLSRLDHRISVFQGTKHSGRIGEVKRQACGLARGDILVELDHDDELTANALSFIAQAFNQYPEAGFAYTDWAEVFEDGPNATYGPNWAFGYGKDRNEVYEGREYIVHQAPFINPKTIRHIVSAPNHIRAWRRDFYESIGGHSRDLAVADDFELCVRTFLATRMIYVPRFCYIQYYNLTGNTQRLRNKDIQRLTRFIRAWNDAKINKRFQDLGVDDFVWTGTFSDFSVPNPELEQHCSLIANF